MHEKAWRVWPPSSSAVIFSPALVARLIGFNALEIKAEKRLTSTTMRCQPTLFQHIMWKTSFPARSSVGGIWCEGNLRTNAQLLPPCMPSPTRTPVQVAILKITCSARAASVASDSVSRRFFPVKPTSLCIHIFTTLSAEAAHDTWCDR